MRWACFQGWPVVGAIQTPPERLKCPRQLRRHSCTAEPMNTIEPSKRRVCARWARRACRDVPVCGPGDAGLQQHVCLGVWFPCILVGRAPLHTAHSHAHGWSLQMRRRSLLTGQAATLCCGSTGLMWCACGRAGTCCSTRAVTSRSERAMAGALVGVLRQLGRPTSRDPG